MKLPSALWLAALVCFCFSVNCSFADEQTDQPSELDDQAAVIQTAINNLIQLQHEDGAWPYEGVYRVKNKIPVGYRIGGTAIVCSALISQSSKESDSVREAVRRGAELILKELKNPLMQPSRTQRYDVRIWGHIYALDFFCRLKNNKSFAEINRDTEPEIQKLVDAIVFQEIDGGGWNYANKRRHCCFVTAPAVQSLLLAKQLGYKVPDEIFARTAKILKSSRHAGSVIPYTGTNPRRDTQAGSVARAPVSEATLAMLGEGQPERLQESINAFHQNWDELEKRRKKTGTHLPPHGIAPYYFYYGHRYLAQAIRLLPNESRKDEIDRFTSVLMKTRDDDGTWNDRVFDQSKAYGTAMSVLALSGSSDWLPDPIGEKKQAPQNDRLSN